MTERKHTYELDGHLICFDQIDYDWQPDDYQSFDGRRHLVSSGGYVHCWVDDFEVYHVDEDGNETLVDRPDLADKIPQIYLEKIADEQRERYAEP